MFVEKRKSGKNVKYFLVYSYREDGKVQKIRKYLGQNITKEKLKEEKEKAKKHIIAIIGELSTEVFLFKLTKGQIIKLNKYDDKIRIAHFDLKQWQRFTEEFVFNTNAIEGSSIQRKEVPEILHKPKAKGSEEIETKGVAKAINYAKTTKSELSIELIKQLHEYVLKALKALLGS